MDVETQMSSADGGGTCPPSCAVEDGTRAPGVLVIQEAFV